MIENYLEAYVSQYTAKVEHYDLNDITPESIEALLTSTTIVYNLVDDLDLYRQKNQGTMEAIFNKGDDILQITANENTIADYMRPIKLAHKTLMDIHANHLDILSRIDITVTSAGISIGLSPPKESDTIAKSVADEIFDNIAVKMIETLVEVSLELMTFCNTCEFVLNKVEEYTEAGTIKPELSLVH